MTDNMNVFKQCVAAENLARSLYAQHLTTENPARSKMYAQEAQHFYQELLDLRNAASRDPAACGEVGA